MATNSTIKLISVNIEKHRHIDRVLPFLKRENPDIICFQEILETDFPMFLKKMGFTGYFVPMSTFLIASVSSSEKIGSGLAIMSKFPLEIEVHHYWGSMESVPEHIHGNIPDSYNRMLLVGKLTKNKDKFSIGNTHFTWSKDGLVDDYQKRDIVKLMDILAKYPEIIFCGDMNVAHTYDDLANPKQNEGEHGFTKEEREGIDKIISAGFVDTFRHFTKGNGHYTWWSHWANARARNVGWRIDYFFVSQKLLPKIKSSKILPAVMGSDHCPIQLEID